MVAKIIFKVPEEWRALPDNKRLDSVTKLYLIKCTTKNIWENGKMVKDYFRIRMFFRSRPDDEVAKIYDYLYSLLDKKIVSLSDIYQLSEIYRKKMLYEKEKDKLRNMEVKEYEEITIETILNM